MLHDKAFIINLHGVGEPPRPYEKGEGRYWLGQTELERVLDFVQDRRRSSNIEITVDDGNCSDYEIVAPELRKRGLNATFFVLAGRLDQVGYLRRSQLRELSKEGFEIGSHGLDHVDWTAADDEALARELLNSKLIIENIIDRRVTAAAIPFGLYDRRVLHALLQFGYGNVFSSDGGPRMSSAWPIPRYSVQSGFEDAALRSRIIGSRFLPRRAASEVRIRLKSSLRISTVQSFKNTLP
jgi:peptidoglycan/xylan/chitin deacetylase (PgdA/CDA1 family)